MVELFLESRNHLLAPSPLHPYHVGQVWPFKKITLRRKSKQPANTEPVNQAKLQSHQENLLYFLAQGPSQVAVATNRTVKTTKIDKNGLYALFETIPMGKQ